METKQTAVEWLNQWHIDNPYGTPTEWRECFNQAIDMEKEQIINAYTEGYDIRDDMGSLSTNPTGQQYYNETYN